MAAASSTNSSLSCLRHSSPLVDRVAIVEEARSWLGTPYHHQASVKQVGCDCLGLLRGVWRAVIGPEPEAMVAYTPDWGQATGEETLLAVANRHLVPIGLEAARPGDVLVFRMKPRAVAKHCGILVGENRFIHAFEKAGTVEANLSDWWQRRVAGAFSFPAGNDLPSEARQGQAAAARSGRPRGGGEPERKSGELAVSEKRV